MQSLSKSDCLPLKQLCSHYLVGLTAKAESRLAHWVAKSVGLVENSNKLLTLIKASVRLTRFATRRIGLHLWFSSDIFVVSTRSITLISICFTSDCIRKSRRFKVFRLAKASVELTTYHRLPCLLEFGLIGLTLDLLNVYHSNSLYAVPSANITRLFMVGHDD